MLQEIYDESQPNVPVLYLWSAGADPTNSIDEFFNKKKTVSNKFGMGEE